MNKKPLLLRTLFALLVLFVFVASMLPLGQKDFYDTLNGLVSDPSDPKLVEVVNAAKAKQKADPSMYASTALEAAATEKGAVLINLVKPVVVKSQKLVNNRDVISLVRKNAAGSLRLGIDLYGGAEFLLELVPEGDDKSNVESDFNRYRDLAIETLRKRLEGKNIFESEISPAGGRLISLRVPIVSKDEKETLERLIKMSAKLQFKLVMPKEQLDQELAKYYANPESYDAPEGYELKKSTDVEKGKSIERVYLVEREAQLDGKTVKDAFPTMNNFGQRQISLSFKTEGAARFGEVTRANIGRQLAIILDGELYSAPTIQSAIMEGNAVITGSFSREDAENISNALVSGSVPFKVNIVAQSDIDPTLGLETVMAGLYSGIAGMALVMLFMLVYYRRAGLVANISLVANAVLILGAMAAFDVTLTLPGIAGIILTIGMAVDANVLIYERIREELANNKTIVNAIDVGFNRAFSAIFDSNITTLFVAAILIWQGTGAIKGFAMTLAIGIFTTLFTAVFLTRIIFDMMLRFTTVKSMKMMHFVENTKIDFLSMTKPAMTLSAILIIGTFVLIGVRGKDAFGIDFTGGTQIEMEFAHAIPVGDISDALFSMGYENKVTYKKGSAMDDKARLEILIREKSGAPSKVVESGAMFKENLAKDLNTVFPKAELRGVSQSTLGALIGDTFMKSAIISLALAVLGMIIYMTIRFQFSYSVAANIALIHDAIVATGIYLAFGGQITLQVVAAVLTIIGYSVNDTIVTFDRLRENLVLVKGLTYREQINLSVNQTLGRTILTGVTVLLVLLMQFFFGGPGIRDFVSVMLAGVVVGCYSSVFIAMPFIISWHRKDAADSVSSSVPATSEAKAE